MTRDVVVLCPLRVKAVEPSSGASERAREGGKEGIGCRFCVDTNFSPSRPPNRETARWAKRAQHRGCPSPLYRARTPKRGGGGGGGNL